MSEPRYTLTLDGFYVLDSWDCYREVFRPSTMTAEAGHEVPLRGEDVRAAAICARFNREHDEWMAHERVA